MVTIISPPDRVPPSSPPPANNNITGRVTEAGTDAGLPGVQIDISGKGFHIPSLTTDSEGYYNTQNVLKGKSLPNGSYTFKAELTGYEVWTASETIELHGGASGISQTVVNFTAEKHGSHDQHNHGHGPSIQGVISNGKGPTLEDVQILIEGKKNHYIFKKTVRDGKFKKEVVSGTYKLYFRDLKSRFTFQPITIEIKDHDSDVLKITPKPNKLSISGIVQDVQSSKKLLRGMTVTISGRVLGNLRTKTFTTNIFGYFTSAEFPLFTTIYTVTCTDPNGVYSFEQKTVALSKYPVHINIKGTKITEEKKAEEKKQEQQNEDQGRKQEKKETPEEEKQNKEQEEGQQENKEPDELSDDEIEDLLEEEPQAVEEGGDEGVDNATGEINEGEATPTESVHETPRLAEKTGKIGEEAELGRNEGGNTLSDAGKNLAKEGIKKLAKEGVKKLASQGLTNAGTGLAGAGAEAGGTAAAGGGAAVVGGLSIGWIILIVLAVILILVIIILIITGGGGNPETTKYVQPTPAPNASTVQQPIPGFTINKTANPSGDLGNDFVDTNQTIIYTITANNSQNQDVTITDTVPDGLAKIVSASPAPTTKTDTSVSWKLQSVGAGPDYSFTLTVQPLKHDISLVNKAIATSIGGTSGNIAECKFYRGYGDAGQSYQSSLLMSYFNNAEQLTGVPAKLLAAFARVESDGPQFSDQDVTSGKCLGGTSPTGASGLMQIEPAGQTGNDPAAISLGVSFLNKVDKYKNVTYASLTSADYCNPEESIILAAGFLIKKMQYAGYGNGTTWDPSWTTDTNAIHKLAIGYYGSSDGSYDGGNYGDDLWNSISQCAEGALAAKGFQTPDQVEKAYNLTLEGFSADEKSSLDQTLSRVSKTNLLPLIQNTIIEKESPQDPSYKYNVSYTDGCSPTIQHGHVVLITTDPANVLHELGHVVAMCNPTASLYTTDFEKAFSDEGGISDYSRNVGSGTGVCPVQDTSTPEKKRELQMQEDYAESISFYLNPNSEDPGLCGGAQGANPYTTGKFAEHKAVVEKVLGSYP